VINDVNNLGVVVGVYLDSRGVLHGVVDKGGKFTTIDNPNAGTLDGQGTTASAIDNEGVIIGNYVDSKNRNHGFVDIGGKFTTFDDPSAGPGGTTPVGTPPSLCPSTYGTFKGAFSF